MGEWDEDFVLHSSMAVPKGWCGNEKIVYNEGMVTAMALNFPFTVHPHELPQNLNT